MKKILLVLTAGLLALAACAPAQPTATGPGVETIVAFTMQALTAAAPATATTAPPNIQPTATTGPVVETVVAPTTDVQTAAPSAQPTAQVPIGLPVSYENVSFVIPLELNASAMPSWTTDVEYPYINPSGGDMPEHLVFEITNYPVTGWARILVFKASDYAAYGEPTQAAVTALLAGGDAAQPIARALAPGDFYAQIRQVNFQNGHGVRYLTEVLTGFAPINNRDIFYFYQGLTNDGMWFVSAVLSVQVSFLVADSDPDSPTPPNGVPFSWSGDLNYPQYLSDVTRKLNNASPADFFPALASLDAMLQSLTILTP